MQVINNTKKQSHLFQNSTFCLWSAVAFGLQSRRGHPVLKTQQSQFCSDLHSEGLLTSWLWRSSAIHLSPYAFSWLHTGTRIACMQPCVGLFPKSPEIILAVQNINTSLCTTLLNTDVALVRALLSRGASPLFAWVPVSYKEISVVLH